MYETKDPAYDSIGEIAYEVTLDSLPIGPGDELFGRVTERRIHSVHSAAQEFRIHPATLRKLLKAAHLVPGAELLSDERVVLPRDRMLTLINRMRGTLDTGDAAAHIGVSRTFWATLVDKGFISPSSETRAQGMRATYKRDDLDAFVRAAYSRATRSYDPSAGLVKLSAAIRHANCTFESLMNLLLGGRLGNVSVNPDERGLCALLVEMEEVKGVTCLPDHGLLSIEAAAKRIGINSKVLRNLVRLNLIETQSVRNPVKKRAQTVISSVAADLFGEQFTTLHILSVQRRENPARLKRKLTVRGVRSVMSGPEVGATFYRRSDLD